MTNNPTIKPTMNPTQITNNPTIHPTQITINPTKKKICNYTCYNNGVCNNGICSCFPNYIGLYCQQETFPPIINKNQFINGININENENFTMNISLLSGSIPIYFFLSDGLHTTNGLKIMNNQLIWINAIANNYPYNVQINVVNDYGIDNVLFQLSVHPIYTSNVYVKGNKREFVLSKSDRNFIYFHGNTSIPNVLVKVWLRIKIR